MQSIPNVATSDAYTDACTLGPDPLATQLVYVVANAAVYAQFRPISGDGTVQDYGPEILLTPTANSVQRCAGARFKSAVAGVPARVVAQLLEPADPQFGGGVPFSSTLAATGGLTPGVASVQVEKDGVLIGQEAALNLIGTNWTITDNGAAGRIDITPGASGLVPLADVVLGASAGSVLFSSIPQTYKHLRIIGKYQLLGSKSPDNWLGLRFNGVTAASYYGQYLRMVAGSLGGANWQDSALYCGTSWGQASDPSALAWFEALIPNYTDTLFPKVCTVKWGNTYNANNPVPAPGAAGMEGGLVDGYLYDGGGASSAITSISFLDFVTGFSLATGSRFTLYGMA